MSSEWVSLTLDDVCLKITDGAHQSPKSVEKGSPMCSVKDLTEFGLNIETARHISVEDFDTLVRQGCMPIVGDVLIAKDGNSALDTVCSIDEPVNAVLLSSVAILRPDPCKIDADFLKYYFKSSKTIDYLKNNFISGAAIPRVVLRDFKKAEILLPDLNKQKAISKILRSIDDKINLNSKVNQTLEQMAQAIFKSWFVDFEPVKAKIAALEAGGSEDDALLAAMQAIAGSALFATDAAGADAPTQLARLQTEHPEQYATLRATAELFPSAMQESELGEMPEGWTTKEIKALSTKISKGSTPRKSDLQNAEDPELIEFLKVRDLSDEGEIARTGLDKIPKSVHSGVLKRSILEADDILFSIAGTIGRVAVIEEELSDSNCNQALAFIRLAEPLKYLELCRLNLVGSRVQNEVVSKVVQGVQANFSLASLGEISIVIPLDGVLYEFNNTVTKFSKKRKELMTEVRVLAELRDTLLPKLLSGELSVSAAADQITKAEEVVNVQS